MPTMSRVPDNHPLMLAWEEHKKSEDFANSKKWAAYPEHLEGSLWALFMAGYNAKATERESSALLDFLLEKKPFVTCIADSQNGHSVNFRFWDLKQAQDFHQLVCQQASPQGEAEA